MELERYLEDIKTRK